MSSHENVMETLPSWVTAEDLKWALAHIKNNAFELDLHNDEMLEWEGETTYHIIPHYSTDASEDVLTKLRRIMTRELSDPEYEAEILKENDPLFQPSEV